MPLTVASTCREHAAQVAGQHARMQGAMRDARASATTHARTLLTSPNGASHADQIHIELMCELASASWHRNWHLLVSAYISFRFCVDQLGTLGLIASPPP